MPSSSFTTNAVVSDNELLKHYRDRDHIGSQDTTTVVLDETILPYPVGETLQDILADLWARMEAIP